MSAHATPFRFGRLIATSSLAILLLGSLAACGDNFADVQAADTIEAYEAFLKNNPDTRFKMEAEDRLESLYLIQAREEGLEGFDKYLERFPEGRQRESAMEERESYAFFRAEKENTKASWEKFMAEYPKPSKEHRIKAQEMLHVHEYSENITVATPVVEQVNLAEDPEGPLDGWKVSADVTNNGERTIESMSLTVNYLDENGRKIGSREWPVVAPYWRVPIEEEHKQPMKPGATVNWNWTSGNLPDGWSRQVRVYVSKIKLVEPGK